jgi:hypothetical protein
MLKHLHVRYPVLAGLLLIFIALIVGEYYGLYYSIPYFDKAMHVIGGAVAAWFVLALLQEEITHMAGWKQVLIVISVTAFIGIVWEWAEYLSQYTQYNYPLFYKYFSGGDLPDTLSDIVADIVGGGIAAIIALKKERS